MSSTKLSLFCSFLVVDSYFWRVYGQRINLNCRFSIAQGCFGDCEDCEGLVGGLYVSLSWRDIAQEL